MTKKVLILIGDAVESLEIYYPYYRCLEQGYEPVIAASSVKKFIPLSMTLLIGKPIRKSLAI